jgi:hypothetical protein
VVGLGVDVGVYAKGDKRGAPSRRGDFAERRELRFRLDVEGEDAGIERERHLLARLAHAREHDPLGRNLDRERAAKLAFRHDVHACAEPSERGENAEIGVGLDRIADQRVLHASEGIGEDAVMTLERRCRITIEGRSYRGGEIDKIDLLGVEHICVGHAAPVGEMVHRRKAGLFEQAVDPKAAGRGFRHLGGRVGLGFRIVGLGPVQRASASTGRKPDCQH